MKPLFNDHSSPRSPFAVWLIGLAACGAAVVPAWAATGAVPAASDGHETARAPLTLAVTLAYGRQRVSLAGVPLGTTTASAYGTSVTARLRAALGPWSRCDRQPDRFLTRLTWPRRGLFIDVRSLAGAPACGRTVDGYVARIALEGVGAAKWVVRTDRGTLRVGMRLAAIPAKLRATARTSTDPEPSTALFWSRQDACRPREEPSPDLLDSALSAWEVDRAHVSAIQSFLTISEGVDC